jgi:putative ABC transport system permease protein
VYDVGLRPGASPADVYSVAELAGLALAGVVIAVAGALPPATWAARNTTSSVLRAE